MLEKLKEDLETVKSCKEFKDYIKENPSAYLTSGFFITEPKNLDNIIWQLDFYNPQKHQLTSFQMQNGLKMEKDQQVFQKEKIKLEKLDLEEVKTNFEQTWNSVKDLINSKYSSETPNKIIVILQKINQNITWNITVLTTSFNVIHTKVDAKNGKILSDKLETIFSFKNTQPSPSA